MCGGEIHALLGQNGAGKSTLIKVLAGVYPPSGGTIQWRGQPANPAAQRLPIAFIHQDLGLVDSMTVAENVAVQAGYPRRRGLIDWPGARAAASRALAAMGSRIDPDTLVARLSAADRSIVAIARALAVKCDILVLDEPTAALPAADVERLLATLRRLRAGGLGIVYVTHRLDEVFRLADRVTVLRDGRLISTTAVSETSAQDLVLKIVGRGVADIGATPLSANQRPLLALHDIVVPHEEAGLIGPVSFSLAAGEILALVGLRGAGHHAVGRALFAALPIRSGHVEMEGRRIAPATPAAAMACGIGFVSSRRGEESLAPAMSVRENLYLNPPRPGCDAVHAGLPRPRAGGGRTRAGPVLGPPARPVAADHYAEWRQPAEDSRRALDGGAHPPAHPRGADHRGRRRLQGGDLPRPVRGVARRHGECC